MNLINYAGGFGADVHLAPDLADFLGTEVMPRTEVTKRIWAYIKEHELQDPSDKRLVVCDAALEKVLKRKTIHMFKMTKELSKVRSHFAIYQPEQFLCPAIQQEFANKTFLLF